ncbi:hypothetical protein ASE25_00915 [Terrabacter sp. Root85]|uniref:hypothetical protein n=1 Tax=unclassified Terrabacter TaxID=2630222 RepID=UPI0006FB0C1C|nr:MULTISPECIES: hypothetical protein [unclassified Terrabacter]KRC91980.1 hypothetical protein ASE25_00915 [Terrabacter sp. Root85]KRF48661.1 hypothetical protein ASH01_02965 [Terrabacter sp. Soil811]
MRTRPALAALAAALTVTVTAGCSTDPTPATDRTRSTVSSATKTGTGDVRTDLEPLTRRFSALGTPVSATWMSGTLGGDAPGPSTYWIDAVVEVTPETATTLRAASPEPTTETPDVEDGVRSALPSGQLLRSTSLDALFAQGSFRAKAYLAADSDTVVLVALGQ